MTIAITGLTKTYRQGRLEVHALLDINLEIRPGSFIVILGPSGGGKSTFLNLLGGMDRPTSGTIHYDGFALENANEDQLTRFRRERIGFVFQFYNLLNSLNAIENVMLPLISRRQDAQIARQKAATLLSSMGLQHRLNHKPTELSGGEQQRVAIARAIIGEPELVIADEPTGDLDSVSASEIIHLMHDLNTRLGLTFVVATHNLALCERADRLIEIKDGRMHG
jgi:putative ABC transport system ATP-binding protein